MAVLLAVVAPAEVFLEVVVGMAESSLSARVSPVLVSAVQELEVER